jgi:hypothetical protein
MLAQLSSRPEAPSQVTPPSQQTLAVNRFEAASVTRNTWDTTLGGWIVSPAGDAFVATNVTLEMLIRWAYGFMTSSGTSPSWQPPHRWATLDLSRIPEPLLTARFEVRGKAMARSGVVRIVDPARTGT